MFSRIPHPTSKLIRRLCSSGPKKFKVTVCGAAGGIGQPLSLLLKFNPMISELALYDINNTKGIAADLSHIETLTKVVGSTGSDQLESALDKADLIMVPAGFPRKPGMDRADLFNTNAILVHSLTKSIAKVAPNALIAIITNPINSIVPVVCETLKKENKFDPNKVFGISTLDIVRANTFAADVKSLDPKDIYVPVIGGHSDLTMIPLLSKTTPALTFSDEEIADITNKVKEAGTAIVKSKEGAGSATLSMAYAAGRFASSLLRAMNGAENIIEIAYIQSQGSEAPYFCQPFLLGKNGIEKHLKMAKLSDFESSQMASALKQLKEDIDMGVNYISSEASDHTVHV